MWHSDTWDLCFKQKRQHWLHTHILYTWRLKPSTLTSLCPCKLIPAEWHIFSGEMTVERALHSSNAPLYNKLYLFLCHYRQTVPLHHRTLQQIGSEMTVIREWRRQGMCACVCLSQPVGHCAYIKQGTEKGYIGLQVYNPEVFTLVMWNANLFCGL